MSNDQSADALEHLRRGDAVDFETSHSYYIRVWQDDSGEFRAIYRTPTINETQVKGPVEIHSPEMVADYHAVKEVHEGGV